MSETKDFNYLLNTDIYSSDSDFVVACYKDLLGRVPGLNELFHADNLLSEGMARKLYLSSVALSPECQERCESIGLQIANIEEFRDLHKAPGFIERLGRKISPEEDSKPVSKPLEFRFEYPCDAEYPVPEISPFDAEFSALNNCQMDALRQYLEGKYKCGGAGDDNGSGNASDDEDSAAPVNAHIGDFAGEMMPGSKAMYDILSDVDEVDTYDNVLITSPSDIHFTLYEEELSRTAKSIRDSLLFTMPVLPGSDAPVSVVFDKHWRGFDPTGIYCERYSTGGETAAIYLMNNTDDTVRARVSFKIISYIDAELVIAQAQNNVDVILDKPSVEVCLDLILLPGYNPVTFSYIGVPYRSEVTGGEAVRFAIRDLEVTTNSWTLSGADAYKLDAMTHGDGYYSHLMSDRSIRFKLHEHGFFEVKAVRFYDDYSVVEEDTTRYLEFRYGDLDTNYQVHKAAPDTSKGASRASVRLYIAKRTGTIE
ncbi:hypothetical protein SAMN04487770_12221 [Butyrivibrio sp. ob235]|uniref:hypothetical protein n=1 Tax=Butyrivibrio sp. ob235 TaxID=1761780 RepID=UPI0008CB2F05|nr:hypothetical protein [Butyrivibrio sp. ob235]SEL96728.1 hypothetical protein SAMN04487770_12221 [Butyrivibrio sp. ob235]